MEDWSEGKFELHSKFLVAAKSQLQEKILKETQEKWDFVDSTGQGGSTTTGNCARALLFVEKNRDIITGEILNQELREKCRHYGQKLSDIIRTVSSGRKIKVLEYKQACTDLNIFLLEELPWVSITPTIHKLLAHTWELIELNNGYGLKSWSEEGLEANNATLRLIRERLSRKFNELVNLEDCFRRLWVGSDPQVSVERSKGRGVCSLCSMIGHRRRSCPTNPRRVLSSAVHPDDLFFFVDT